MSPKPTRMFDVLGLGQVPVTLNCDADGPIVKTSPDEDGNRYIDLLRSRNPAIRRFHDPHDKIPSYAIEKQKIVVLTASQVEALQNGDLTIYAISNRRSWLSALLDWLFGNKRSRLRGKRRRLLQSLSSKEAFGRITVSDCPNPPDEYGNSEEPTFTVLLEWTESTANRFPAIEIRDANGQLIDLGSEQTNNFLVICGGDPNHKPGPPFAAKDVRLNSQPTDFKILTPDDIRHYEELAERHRLDGPTVAVVDTGIKFNLHNAGEPPLPDDYIYQDAEGKEREFVLACRQQSSSGYAAIPENRFGYCSIDAYKQQSFADQLGCEIQDIRNSPFDDNRFFSDPRFTTYLDGRHGTSIAAIIQQRANVAVLPVKVFDNLGLSTLFDMLNALNCILQQRKQEPDKIYIINASWIFERNEPLLEHKIEQLMQAGIFVIAAAGNRNQTRDRNLDHVPVYPACYSEKYPNVITVTSVAKALSHELPPQARLDEAGLTITIPTRKGFEAVENFSTRYVNVGVVSMLGSFPSPFLNSPSVCGSSFACAYVSAAVAAQLRNPPAWMLAGNVITDPQMRQEREDLLKVMCKVDIELQKQAVLDGYYLEI